MIIYWNHCLYFDMSNGILKSFIREIKDYIRVEWKISKNKILFQAESRKKKVVKIDKNKIFSPATPFFILWLLWTFNSNIKSNIELRNPKISKRLVFKAMESANLHKIRRKKPKTCFHTKIDKRKKNYHFSKNEKSYRGKPRIIFLLFHGHFDPKTLALLPEKLQGPENSTKIGLFQITLFYCYCCCCSFGVSA